MAILHMAENEARGRRVGEEVVVPALDVMLGDGGKQFSTFLTAKLGRSDSPLVNSIAYSTFGPDRMPEYHLWKTGPSDFLDNITGVFDVTTSMQNETFDANDFNYELPRTPVKRNPGRYTELTPLTEMLKAPSTSRYHPGGSTFSSGTSLSNICRVLQSPEFSSSQITRYDKSLCFMFLICCTGADPAFSPSTAAGVLSKFPAYTGFSVPPI